MWCKLQVHSGSRSPFACTSWLGWFQESSSICSTDRTILISIARKTRSACLWLPRLLTFELEVREAHYSSDRFRLNSRTWPFSDWAIFQRLTQNIGRASKASHHPNFTCPTWDQLLAAVWNSHSAHMLPLSPITRSRLQILSTKTCIRPER